MPTKESRTCLGDAFLVLIYAVVAALIVILVCNEPSNDGWTKAAACLFTAIAFLVGAVTAFDHE